MRYLALTAGFLIAAALTSPALADSGHSHHSGSGGSGAHHSSSGHGGGVSVHVSDGIIRPYALSHPWHYGVDWRGRAYPGVSLGFHDGRVFGHVNLGGPRYGYCSPHYVYDPYYGWPTTSYYVGGRPVYVFGDTGYGINVPVRDYSLYNGGYATAVDPEAYSDSAASDDNPGEPVPVTTFNDNSVTNNYYGTAPAQAQAAPQHAAGTPVPVQVAPRARAIDQRAFGQRFTDEVRLETPDGAYRFVLRNGGLYAGLESGKAQRIADNADVAFDAFAAWIPGDGVCVFYRDGDGIFAAYPTGTTWAKDPLPYIVSFGTDTSIGLVNGLPWAVFNTTDGARYVVQFGGHQWNEVGNAKARPGKPRT